jgi:hypothetical protein
LINQLRRKAAGLLRSLALLWRGTSLDCSIVQQDGAPVISGGLIDEKNSPGGDGSDAINRHPSSAALSKRQGSQQAG